MQEEISYTRNHRYPRIFYNHHAAYWVNGYWGSAAHCLYPYLDDRIDERGMIRADGTRSKYACPSAAASGIDYKTIGMSTIAFGPANTWTERYGTRAAYFQRWCLSSKIKTPSAVGHFGDASSGSWVVDYRHNNTTNVVFLDGHVGIARFYPLDITYYSQAAYKIFWGIDDSLYN